MNPADPEEIMRQRRAMPGFSYVRQFGPPKARKKRKGKKKRRKGV